MILGIGIDIVHVPRIEVAVERFGDRFIDRVFCQKEAQQCLCKRDPYPSLAGRFAAKEAFVKALGTGFRLGVALTQICVDRKDSGAPYLNLLGKARELAEIRGVTGVHLSISHEDRYAVAMVVLEGVG